MKFPEYIAKFLRRFTSLSLWVVAIWILIERPPMLRDVFQSLLNDAQFRNMSVLSCYVWYLLISEGSLLWMSILPIYLVFFPLIWIITKSIKFIFTKISSHAPNTTTQELKDERVATHAGKKPQVKGKRTVFGMKLVVHSIFAWFVFYLVLRVNLFYWFLPIALLPIWIWFLKICYSCSVKPVAFAEFLLKVCSYILDNPEKNSSEKSSAPQKENDRKFRLSLVSRILKRYKPEEMLSIVQREAILFYGIIFSLTFAMSAFFWALIAKALLLNNSVILASYHFFTSNSLADCLFWAFGCMTTSIGFPGDEATTLVKLLHCSLVLTGIAQLTFFVTTFCIMISTRAQTTAQNAHALAKDVTSKIKKLENTITDGIVIEVAESKSN